MRDPRTLLITGGSGFIGSNLIRWLFHQNDFSGRIVNLDLLTYAGNPANLAALAEISDPERYRFVHGDIGDAALLDRLFREEPVDVVIHLAAESHVDRSIRGPAPFITTNVVGTLVLLEAARQAWQGRSDVLFHHVSTDEVFGSLGETGYFSEKTAYDPRSPYSASKAASDHLVRAWAHTFGLPVTISNCSNNYGPFQFPEKLIPLMIMNMLERKALPVYGDGRNVRDWLFVEDHAAAIWKVVKLAEPGTTWLVGGENEWENLTLVHRLAEIVGEAAGMDPAEIQARIEFVGDRPGHDRRYAIDCERIKKDLAWRQTLDFTEGLQRTVQWYLGNREWVESVRSGAYREWIETHYGPITGTP